MRRLAEFVLSALVVLLAVIVIVGGWIVLANGLGFGIGVPTVWQGSIAPLLLGAAALVVVAAVLALIAQRSLAIARALAVVALAATVSVFDRWSAAPPALGAIAVPLTTLVIPALFALATISRPRWRIWRTMAWVVAWVASVVILVFRDPFLDPLCAGSCGSSPFALAAQPDIVLAARWLVAVIALAAFGAGLVAAVPRGGTGLIAAIPQLSAVLTLGIGTFAFSSDSAWASGLIPGIPDAGRAWLAGLTVLGVSHIVAAAAIARRRAAVLALADELTSETSSQDDLATRLRLVLGDGGVRVAYPLTDGPIVDAEGHLTSGAAAGETATLVRREDDIVAVIVHPTRIHGDELATAFGPAAGLALANVRTRAVIRATLLELQALRVRLVDAGDDTRREVERNLHDGVQQTLLVLQYELALAAGDPESSPRRELEHIRDEVKRLTERTRELGHGLFPMSLDDVGLDAALQRLADDSLVPFEPVVDLPERPPRSVERTAYLVARDAVAAATGSARVQIHRESDSVVIDVVGGRLTPISLDRIDALGGRIDELGSGMKVVLPCA